MSSARGKHFFRFVKNVGRPRTSKTFCLRSPGKLFWRSFFWRTLAPCILVPRGADLCWALGGIICSFTPILPYFEDLGDKARQLFFSLESNMTNVQHASGQIKWRPKEKQKKVQRSSSAQMHTIVKLLWGMQSNYWGDISPFPWVSAPLLGPRPWPRAFLSLASRGSVF